MRKRHPAYLATWQRVRQSQHRTVAPEVAGSNPVAHPTPYCSKTCSRGWFPCGVRGAPGVGPSDPTRPVNGGGPRPFDGILTGWDSGRDLPSLGSWAPDVQRGAADGGEPPRTGMRLSDARTANGEPPRPRRAGADGVPSPPHRHTPASGSHPARGGRRVDPPAGHEKIMWSARGASLRVTTVRPCPAPPLAPRAPHLPAPAGLPCANGLPPWAHVDSPRGCLHNRPFVARWA